MDEIKKAELAIKQMKDYIELLKAAAKMSIADNKDKLNSLAHSAVCAARDIAAEIAGGKK